jgi:hypothetical protein
MKNLIKSPRELLKLIKYFSDFAKYNLSAAGKIPSRTASVFKLYPCLDDDTTYTGFDRHYIYHPAWAARILSKTKPKKHIDISSTLSFSSIISAFIPTEFYDIRSANLILTNLKSKSADLTRLPFKDGSIGSLSCMHTVEHVGLGRYGDPIDPDGDVKAIEELIRVTAVDGNLLFVVPVGKPIIMFNAHRIYSYGQIYKYFKKMELVEFSMIPDDPTLSIINNCDPRLVKNQKYACGCFWFKKRRIR